MSVVQTCAKRILCVKIINLRMLQLTDVVITNNFVTILHRKVKFFMVFQLHSLAKETNWLVYCAEPNKINK